MIDTPAHLFETPHFLHCLHRKNCELMEPIIHPPVGVIPLKVSIWKEHLRASPVYQLAVLHNTLS